MENLFKTRTDEELIVLYRQYTEFQKNGIIPDNELGKIRDKYCEEVFNWQILMMTHMFDVIAERWIDHRNQEIEHQTTLKKLLSGEWVDSKKVQDALGLSFSECCKLFDFSREADWWRVVGETEEERKREGQKITTKFRIRQRE